MAALPDDTRALRRILLGIAFPQYPIDDGSRAMPSRYQIHCVARSDRFNHHQRLRHIGGVNRDGARWRITEAEAIAAIETGRWAFFIEYRGRQWDVVVTVSKYGDKYLRTAADNLHPDSLLSLPECT